MNELLAVSFVFTSLCSTEKVLRESLLAELRTHACPLDVLRQQKEGLGRTNLSVLFKRAEHLN